jgi:phosphohistidine phosphatase SixA
VLIGHNPWLTALINYCGYTLDNLPTWGVVVFDYTADFRGNFEPKKCVFVKQYFPKEVASQ